jgi:uncharacterized protein YndB with AHSA1/START domain
VQPRVDANPDQDRHPQCASVAHYLVELQLVRRIGEAGPGGRLVEILPDGEIYEIGQITAWEPPVRLAFTWRQESFARDQLTQVEVRFEPVGDETRVKVQHYGWDTIPPEHVARHHFPDAIFLQRHAEMVASAAVIVQFTAFVFRWGSLMLATRRRKFDSVRPAILILVFIAVSRWAMPVR